MKQEMMSVLVYIIKIRKLRNGECPVLLRVTIDLAWSDIRINRSVKEELFVNRSISKINMVCRLSFPQIGRVKR